MSPLVDYAMAYVVSPDGRQVALLKKERPHYLKGKWMGVAGHVESHEIPLMAVQREFKEEAGVLIKDWEFVKILERPERPSNIHVFFACHDLSQVRTMTDEEVRVFPIEEIGLLAQGNALSEIEDELRGYAEVIRKSQFSAPAPSTSDPIGGWVAVQVTDPRRAHGQVDFNEASEREPVLFSLVNIDGSTEPASTSKLGNEIVRFVESWTGITVDRVHFFEAVCERLSLASPYIPEPKA